ncbi:hypothetical protein LEMLEM_LOCUS12677 [Lemmus lemmus]
MALSVSCIQNCTNRINGVGSRHEKSCHYCSYSNMQCGVAVPSQDSKKAGVNIDMLNKELHSVT